jgi:uncharacterized Tic20 family protein
MPRRKKEAEVVPQVEVTPVETSPAPVPERDAPALAPVLATPALAPAGLTLEERRMAAVAHGSVLLNLVSGGFLGPLAALILWLLYDRKSEYVSWHALQALVFQLISLLLFLVLGVVTGLLWAVTAALLPIVVGFCLVPIALGFSTVTAALVVGSLIYGCAGALAVLDGRDFRYRWVADWIPPLHRP